MTCGVLVRDRAQMIPGKFHFAVNVSMMFRELPPLARCDAAVSAGFGAVESRWPFSGPLPADGECDAFVRAVLDSGARLIALNFYSGDLARGERGVLSVPGREDEFRASVDVLVEIAERTGCRRFNALYGQRVRGILAQRQDSLADENLRFAAAAVGRIGGTVLLEPLTSGENGTYPLRTAVDVLRVMTRQKAAGCRNVALLLDAYHLANNGDVPAEVARDYFTEVGHVQVADTPGRHEPGTGTIDFGSLFESLAEQSYQQYVALEYQPSTSSHESLGWLPRRDRSR